MNALQQLLTIATTAVRRFLADLPDYPRWVQALFVAWVVYSLALGTAILFRPPPAHAATAQVLLDDAPVQVRGELVLLQGDQEIRRVPTPLPGDELVLRRDEDPAELSVRFEAATLGGLTTSFVQTAERLWQAHFVSPPPPPQPEPPSRFRGLNEDPAELSEDDLERYLGQIFLVGFDGDWWTPPVPDNVARTLLRDYGVGGVLLFERNVPYLESADSLAGTGLVKLIAAMKRAAVRETGLPLIVTTDYEGGDVQALRGGLLTELPAAMAVASLQDPDAAYLVGRIVGTELRAFGFNMNLGPVVDVNTNSHNDLIGDRSFGGDPKLVAELASRFLEGQGDGGVLGVLKHFPGHGSSGQGDETPLPPRSSLEPASLEHALLPFRQPLAQASAVMTSHFVIDKLSPVAVTFERRLSRDLLRGTETLNLNGATFEPLGFDGVLLSDDLCSPSITAEDESDNSAHYADRVALAARAAFDAGHDLLIVGHVFPRDAADERLVKPGKQYRLHLRLDEFAQVYESLRSHIFEEPDVALRRERIAHLRESLGRIWRLKRTIERLEDVERDYSPFQITPSGPHGEDRWLAVLGRMRKVHAAIAAAIFDASFSILKKGVAAPELSRLTPRDRVGVFFPTRHETYEAAAQAQVDNVTKNVEAWNLPRAIARSWQPRMDLRFHMFPRYPVPGDHHRTVQGLAALAADADLQAAVFILWSRSQWELFCKVLEEVEAAGGDLSRIVALVTSYPNLLDPPIGGDATMRRLDQVTLIIGYRGDRVHGRRLADLLVRENERLELRTLPVRVQPWQDLVVLSPSPHPALDPFRDLVATPAGKVLPQLPPA